MNDIKSCCSNVSSTYLTDESGVTGTAEAIFFPETRKELKDIVSLAYQAHQCVVIQGARTGFNAGAVPNGGFIINLSKMNAITGFRYDEQKQKGMITVQAGCTLDQIRTTLQRKQLDTRNLDEESQKHWECYKKAKNSLCFFPNPTEATATIGGVVATGAGGSYAYSMGEVSEHIESILLLLPNGRFLHLRKSIQLKDVLGASGIDGTPFMEQDAVSCVCGSEGTLGIIVEITLRLHLKPEATCGLLSFHDSMEQAANYFNILKETAHKEKIQILAADWFDQSCDHFLQNSDRSAEQFSHLPHFPTNANVAIWLEFLGDEEAVYSFFEAAMTILESNGNFEDDALAATEIRDMERLGSFRHAVTEAVNLVKTGNPSRMIDWIAPTDQWARIAHMVKEFLNKNEIPYVMMGHVGDGRASLRFPQMNEDTGSEIISELTKLLLQNACICSQEHGYGRLKRELFAEMQPETYRIWSEIRKEVDPAGLLNPGVMTGEAQREV